MTVLEIFPGGKKDEIHEAGAKSVSALLQDLVEKQKNEAETLDRVIVITHGKRGFTFRIAGSLANGGLSFWDAMAMLGFCKAMMVKKMERHGLI